MARQRGAVALLERLRQLAASSNAAAFCSSAAGSPVRPQTSGQLAPFGRASWLAQSRPSRVQQQRCRSQGMRWAQVRAAGSVLQPAGTGASAGGRRLQGPVGLPPTGGHSALHLTACICIPDPADSGRGAADSGGCSSAQGSGVRAADGAAPAALQQGAAVAQGAGHLRIQLEADRGEVQGREAGRIPAGLGWGC